MPDREAHGDHGGELHRALRRQVRQLGLSLDTPPDAAGWAALLDRVSATYRAAEADRYTLERSLEVSSEEMRTLHDALSDLARHDVLTRLPNRLVLTEYLQTALDRSPLSRRRPAVLFIDLDGFKLVNDGFGHRAGDDLLVRVAERIRATSRETDLVARIGGDEFVVALDEVDGSGPAVATAQRIIDTLRQPFTVDGRAHVIGASIGIALAPDGHTTADELVRLADLAMYEAKARGRNQCVVYGAPHTQSSTEHAAPGITVRRMVAADP